MTHNRRVIFSAFLGGATLCGCVVTDQAWGHATPFIPERTCSILDSGAQGSAIWSQLSHYETMAIQAAIDRCAKAGGGTVEVPAGEWLTGPIALKSNIRLHLAKGAQIVAATDPALYGGDAADGERVGIVSISDAHDVAISGEGTIDGQGAVWWERMRALWRSDPRFAQDGQARQQFRETRPRLVLVSNSRNVAIEGVKLLNSPSYHVVFYRSEYLTVRGVEIRAPVHAPNTDAIDPVESRHVLIADNVISVGDDAVAIKSGRVDPAHPDAVSSDIQILRNHILAGRGICIGSQTTGGVARVLAQDNIFEGSMYGFRIKSARGKGGKISDIVFRNTRMIDVEVPVVITAYYAYRPMDARVAAKQLEPTGFLLGNQIWPGDKDPAQPFVANSTPEMTGIGIDGLTAVGADRAGIAVGLPEKPLSGVTFRNVSIQAKEGFLVRHASINTQGSKLESRDGTPVRLQAGGKVTGR